MRSVQDCAGAHVELEGFNVLCSAARYKVVRPQCDMKLSNDLPRDRFLQSEDIGQLAIITPGPELGTGAGVGKFRAESDLIAALAHAALEYVVDIELGA